MVNFFGLEVKKKKKVKPNHEFSDEDRALSLLKRQQKAELNTIQHELAKTKLEMQKFKYENDLEDLKERLGYYEEEEEDNPLNGILTTIAASILTKGSLENDTSQVNHPSQQTNSIQTAEKDLTDDEILRLLDKIPKALRNMLKKMDDEQILQMAKGYLPGYSDATLQRAIVLVKN